MIPRNNYLTFTYISMVATIVPQIIADAYIEARCDTWNVAATSAIRYCDDVYQDLLDEKKLINEDFIKKTSKIDTVIFKNKYTLPTDFEKMKQISIKYSVPTYDAWVTWTVYYVDDKVVNGWLSYISNVDHTAWATFAWDSTKWVQIYEWYIPCSPRTLDFDFQQDFNNISESSPVYFYENNELQIYPRPKEVVKEWIFFDYIPSETTLTTLTDDSLIKIEKKFYKAWVFWVALKYTNHMWKDWTTLDFEYQRQVMKCQKRWRDRHYSPIAEELPSSLLKYMR